MPDNEKKYKNLRAAAWLTQFGLNMVSPIILALLLASWLKNKFGFGSWVVFLAVVFGVGAAFTSMFSFIKTVRRESGGKNDDKKDNN